MEVPENQGEQVAYRPEERPESEKNMEERMQMAYGEGIRGFMRDLYSVSQIDLQVASAGDWSWAVAVRQMGITRVRVTPLTTATAASLAELMEVVVLDPDSKNYLVSSLTTSSLFYYITKDH
jgi:hypothetical protein